MKKLLVWDADETLWRGTLLDGDDVALFDGRRALIEALTERGVLQAIASRNVESDVRAKLAELDLADHFLVVEADLERPKSAMVASVVEALGLTRMTDVAFVDDQPFNREEVAASPLTQGCATLAPEDLDAFVREHFTKASYTDEDRKRVARYRAEQTRTRAAKAYGDDYRAFLASCEMVVTIAPATDDDMPRIVDLVARANRMAAMEAEFDAAALHDMRERLLAVRVRDRFGDYGLSAVAAVVPDWPEHVWNIPLLVVSCRLQGKGIGSAILGAIINTRPGARIVGRWRETPYNVGMRELYRWYGFEDVAAQDGLVVFAREGGPVALPPWLAVRVVLKEPVEYVSIDLVQEKP